MKMKRTTRHYIILALIALGLYGMYIVIMPVLGLPLYVLLLAYLAVIVVVYLINRKNTWAVRGNYFYVTGNYVQAKPLLDKAIAAGTKSPAAHTYRALLHLKEDKDAAAAYALLDKAAALSGSVMDERNRITALASCHWLDGRIDDGINVLEDMRASHEYINAGVLTTLGYLYLTKGDFDKAIEITQLAMADDPEYGAAWDNMGQIHYKMGDVSAAKENFRTALAKKENLADSNYFLGLIAEADEDSAVAADHFRRAHICTIGLFNTATPQQIEQKYMQYHSEEQ